ncbi:uncharacterized protein LOC142338577 [Convolutriloba macropyga]|uniref:uncharacterized protein LOC142338577 n=1 Tax=Convolutriloba macropyga TaxID=536237 RepID=UPI003F527317
MALVIALMALLIVGLVVILCVMLIPDDSNSETIRKATVECPANFKLHEASGVPDGKTRCLHAKLGVVQLIDDASQYCDELEGSRLPIPKDEDDTKAIFSFMRNDLSPSSQRFYLGFSFDYMDGWSANIGYKLVNDIMDYGELRGRPYECLMLDENGATDAKCDLEVSVVCELLL